MGLLSVFVCSPNYFVDKTCLQCKAKRARQGMRISSSKAASELSPNSFVDK